jgi:hypothetical protein|tara:strand:- start:14 stop:229 length:216 start_codon:yes stop_codon:yes gene_type:complete
MLGCKRGEEIITLQQHFQKMDAASENHVSFGSIFDNKINLYDDSESSLLNYSKPEYAASFSNYTDCRFVRL